MLLQDEQYVVKWLSQYGALPKAQITFQSAAEICR